MRINYNASAMLANNALANNDTLLSKSLERLSSGLKINHAKDNPAGLAMAKRMNAQIEGIGVANQNATDAISIIETADGALTEVSDMIQRMSELSVQAANDTLTDEDRQIIQDEVANLKSEINRVSNTTQFNSQNLLDGTFDLKGYCYDAADPANLGPSEVKVSTYSANVEIGKYTIDSLSVTANGDELKIDFAFSAGSEFPGELTDYSTSMVDDQLTITGPDGFSIRLTLPVTADEVLEDGKSFSTSSLMVDCTGLGAMRAQVGANEGQVLEIEIPAVNLKNMGLDGMDVSTAEGARDALERLNNATTFLSGVRGKLGAYQNRLESTVNTLDITSENMTSSYSRIMDVDMAEEMTSYTTYTVLTQAGTSVLAQANDRPSQVLQLLQ